MMKKSVLIAALGLFSLNTMAQDAPKEEGFVFTTVKENPIIDEIFICIFRYNFIVFVTRSQKEQG